ncbi:hypothetical protein RJ640_017134 [Escallonia rubra]|uniref:Zinc finger CCCH domain-containing protein 19 n=1 Tax=Escallonia rubra TaxID=112253 RepID=A0AA88UCX0_9ASTE|nr:hypothetical protein RJ640_017134 [Escallonia rubra]
MEEDEDNSSQVNQSPLHVAEATHMDGSSIGTNEPSTDELHFVPDSAPPESDGVELVGAESQIAAVDGGATVAEEVAPEAEPVISGGLDSVSEPQKFGVVDAEPPSIALKDGEGGGPPVVVEEIPVSVNEVETGQAAQLEEEAGNGGGGEEVVKFCAEPVAVAKGVEEDEAAVGERISAEVGIEEVEMETPRGGDDSQLVGAEATIVVSNILGDEGSVGEANPMPETKLELGTDTKLEMESESEVAKSSGGGFDFGDLAVAKEEHPMLDMTTETEMEDAVVKVVGLEGMERETELSEGVGVEERIETDEELAKDVGGEEGMEAEAEMAKGVGWEEGMEAEAEMAKGVGWEEGMETEAEVEKGAGEEEGMETEAGVGVGGEDGMETEAKVEKGVGGEDETETEEEVQKGVGGEEGMETEAQVQKGVGGDFSSELEDSQLVEEEEDEAVVAEEEAAEMDTETDVAEAVKVGGGKRKRARNNKVQVRASARKTVEEDVCFICFDGGDLVLCDRRGCPKAYHPSCVNRDEAFFRAKGRWNCGWHLCSICEKNALYMCYTCTFSLCKACIKDAVILCVRGGNKGFCETCMKTVMLIENNEQGNKEVDFDDKSSWEYLFKDYYIDLRTKLSLSSVELSQAKNPWKGSDLLAGKLEAPDEQLGVNDDGGSGSDNSNENLEVGKPKRRKTKRRSKSVTKKEALRNAPGVVSAEEIATTSGNTEWATKELLEFVMHMKDGDKSVLSQFDVQALLLDYIKRNKLRDPRRKSQIICDARLENLFGKARVGHFEMLKLLESHFLIKEDLQIDDVQGSVVDTESSQLDADGGTEGLSKGSKDRKRKARKKGDARGRQSNLDDYAAIDIHNIGFIYLRRKLMEDLLEDVEKFRDMVVGTFVRIRISGSTQKQDIYRLVQVVGTTKAEEPYKVGKRTTDIMLDILNLNKMEVISIDTISNQEFTEDECKRLRQSIKCGLINRLTVGDILDKAIEFQTARVNDSFGRRLSFQMAGKIREMFTRPKGSSYSRKGREPISPGKGDFASKDSWSGTRKNPSKSWELDRNLSSKSLSNKAEDATLSFEALHERSSPASSPGTVSWSSHSAVRADSYSGVASETSLTPLSAPVIETAAKVNETDKTWHYKDPSGKAQGPFSMVQLRKWSNTGYFPADLKIWRTGGNEDASVLLTDALAGRFTKEFLSMNNGHPKDSNLQTSHIQSTPAVNTHGTSDQIRGATPLPKVLTVGLVSDSGGRNDAVNLPSPTPKPSSSFSSANGPLQSPSSATPVNSQKAPLSISPSTNQSGVLQPTRVPENDPATSLQATQLTVTGESQAVQTYGHMLPASDAAAHMVQPINGQNHPYGAHGWGSAPSQHGQALAYGQWGGVPSTAQNPAGNFSTQGVSALPPPPDSWRPPNPGTQPNMQPSVPPTLPWGMGIAETNTSAPNTGWGTLPGNPNMGWGGPAPANMNVNWGPTLQGPSPGNPNPGWVMPTGNVNPGWVAPNQGPANVNHGWAAPTGPGPVVPGPVPSGNPVANNVQGAGPGNANSGWGSPGASQGMRGSEQHQQHNGDRFSGRRERGGSQGGDSGGGRSWNRQSSFGSGGGSGGSSRHRSGVCRFHESGHCKKGDSCDFLHT